MLLNTGLVLCFQNDKKKNQTPKSSRKYVYYLVCSKCMLVYSHLIFLAILKITQEITKEVGINICLKKIK